MLLNKIGNRQGLYDHRHMKGENHPCWKGGVSIGTNKKEYYKNHNERYYEANKEKFRLKTRLRRINQRSTNGIVTPEMLQLLYEDNIKKHGTLSCYLCFKAIAFGKDCIEHKIPLSRGGSNFYDNLGISCRPCNTKKRNKTEEEYHLSIS